MMPAAHETVALIDDLIISTHRVADVLDTRGEDVYADYTRGLVPGLEYLRALVVADVIEARSRWRSLSRSSVNAPS